MMGLPPRCWWTPLGMLEGSGVLSAAANFTSVENALTFFGSQKNGCNARPFRIL